jgi:hypothetical protein
LVPSGRSGIPLDALADEARRVAWRNELRGAKVTKVPDAPKGRRAKANDPSTWDTRPEAEVRVPVDRDHGFRWKMITQSGGT